MFSTQITKRLFQKNLLRYSSNNQNYIDRTKETALIYRIDKSKFESLNNNFERAINLSLTENDQITLKSFINLVHKDDIYLLDDLILHLQNNLTVNDPIEFRIQLDKNNISWCRAEVIDIKDIFSKRVVKAIKFILETDYEREARHWMNEQKKALDYSSILAESDLRGRITYVNDNFCEISKFDRSELIGKTFRIINSGYHTKDFFENLWKTIRSGNIWKGEIQNNAKDGTLYWMDTTIIPFKHLNGQIYKYVSVRHEITKEKELLKNLEKQIEVTQGALVSLSKKDEYISHISHEVRNNLGHILGFAELLLANKNTNQNDFLERIHKASDQTLHLMTNILDLMRLNNLESKLNLIETKLNEVIFDAIDISRLSIEKKKLELRIQLDEKSPITVLCDKHRLTQVFLNLLSNAVKYTDKGSIAIKTKLIAMNNNSEANMLFCVSDTGRGISIDKMPTLFKDYEQCSDNDTAVGYGLGLAICKRTIELMGGKIWAESDQKGSSFYFQIPLQVVTNLNTKRTGAHSQYGQVYSL